MHLIYSALRNLNQQQENHKVPANNVIMLRYKAYQATCHKYNREIAAIQKYLPGWLPAFNY
jgi:hypothetical protein